MIESQDQRTQRIWDETLLHFARKEGVVGFVADGNRQDVREEFARRLLGEQPICACGDSFTSEALCHNCVAGLSKTAEQRKQEPIDSIERRNKEWDALEDAIKTYLDDYEYGEEGYTPSQF